MLKRVSATAGKIPSWFWIIAGLLLGSFLYAGLSRTVQEANGPERGMVIVITGKCLLLVIAALVVLILLYRATIKAKSRFKGAKILVYYLSFGAWPAALILALTMVFNLPYQIIDLVAYFQNGTVSEQTTKVTKMEEKCHVKGYTCSLHITTAEGGYFEVEGHLKQLLESGEKMLAIRYLPSSNKVISIQTKKGWK